LLTKPEKERRVIELYEEGKTYREIAKEVRISPGDISSIIRRHTGEDNVEGGNGDQRQQEETIDTQVFKLLEAGRTPVQVATDLDLNSGEVTRLYKEWWKLKGLDQLNDLYEEIGDDIFQFHQTYKFIKNEGYTPRQLIEAAEHLDDLPLLRSEREQLVQENQDLEEEKQNKLTELRQTDESIAIAERKQDTVNLDIEVRKEELRHLHLQKQCFEHIISRANSSAGYQQIRSIAEAAARSILTQNKVVLAAALRALFQALRYEPRNELQLLIYGSLSYPLYEPGLGKPPQNYLQLRQALLLQSAEEIYQDLLSKVVHYTMSSALNMPTGSGAY